MINDFLTSERARSTAAETFGTAGGGLIPISGPLSEHIGPKALSMVSERLQRGYLARIERGLQRAATVIKGLASSDDKQDQREELIKKAERQISDMLRKELLVPGEGWLCEEDLDGAARLDRQVVWVVDPVDGTQEFINGYPEWSVSVGLVIEETAIAGGIYNPSKEELFLGSRDLGVKRNGRVVCVRATTSLDGALVLASRQEFARGEWKRFHEPRFHLEPIGSVAYKMALVSSGYADATWTLVPKHEWDVAAGVALVRAAGGHVSCPTGADLRFNQRETLIRNLMACAPGLWQEINQLLESVAPAQDRVVKRL